MVKVLDYDNVQSTFDQDEELSKSLELFWLLLLMDDDQIVIVICQQTISHNMTMKLG